MSVVRVLITLVNASCKALNLSLGEERARLVRIGLPENTSVGRPASKVPYPNVHSSWLPRFDLLSASSDESGSRTCDTRLQRLKQQPTVQLISFGSA